MTTASVPTSAAPSTERGPVWRFPLRPRDRKVPVDGEAQRLSGDAVLATIILYYTYYTQTGVTPNILRYYHMSFSYYVWIVIISNLIGAFASLAGQQDRQVGTGPTSSSMASSSSACWSVSVCPTPTRSCRSALSSRPSVWLKELSWSPPRPWSATSARSSDGPRPWAFGPWDGGGQSDSRASWPTTR